MNYKMMGRLIALILAMEAVFMLPALLICLYDGATAASAYGFLYTIGILLVAAGALALLCRRAKAGFYAKEGMVCVGVSWILLSLLGCLPFYFSRSDSQPDRRVFRDGLRLYHDGGLHPAGCGGAGPGACCSGAASATGWAAWACWCFCWPSRRSAARTEGFTMHLLRAESPDPAWASWFRG